MVHIEVVAILRVKAKCSDLINVWSGNAQTDPRRSQWGINGKRTEVTTAPC